jgi:hypothetical protein
MTTLKKTKWVLLVLCSVIMTISILIAAFSFDIAYHFMKDPNARVRKNHFKFKFYKKNLIHKKIIKYSSIVIRVETLQQCKAAFNYL